LIFVAWIVLLGCAVSAPAAKVSGSRGVDLASEAPADIKDLKIADAAPDFSLKGVDDKTYTLADFKDAKVLMVVFLSNHCPYSHAAETRLLPLVAELKSHGLGVVAINPNNPSSVDVGELGYSKYNGNPPMTADGKAALLDAIASGKGFVGVHSATDTFHTGETAETNTNQPRTWRYRNLGDKADPYTRMIGAEFIIHSVQQSAKLRIVDPKFPGMPEQVENIEINDEWYSMTDFSKDLHVLLVQETAGMTGIPYQRPPYPATWARAHAKGRVFYTSMGHREDVWTNPVFQQLLLGGLAWACDIAEADIPPNMEKVTPNCWKLPPLSAPVSSDPAKYKPERY
jgi:hypothetical protein